MGMGILAGLVDVEAVMGVLERRDLKSACDDAGNDFGEERSLAGAAPAGQADNAHAALYSNPKRACGDSESTAAIMKAPGNHAGRLNLRCGPSATLPAAFFLSAAVHRHGPQPSPSR